MFVQGKEIMEKVSERVKLPSVTRKKYHEEATISYQTSYKRDYCPKKLAVKVHQRPASASRKHNPQPRHVFLLRRMFNEPVCNVWTKPGGPAAPVAANHIPPKSCAQYSYQSPMASGHPNFDSKPTRFGSNKFKPQPALGIVPAINILGEHVTARSPEPLSMDIKGKKRVISAAYVLDQQLPQFRALEDMKSRANGSLDLYLSHAIKKPSRRKLIDTRPTSLTGSSMKVKAMEELCSLQQPVNLSSSIGQEIRPIYKLATRCRLPQVHLSCRHH